MPRHHSSAARSRHAGPAASPFRDRAGRERSTWRPSLGDLRQRREAISTASALNSGSSEPSESGRHSVRAAAMRRLSSTTSSRARWRRQQSIDDASFAASLEEHREREAQGTRPRSPFVSASRASRPMAGSRARTRLEALDDAGLPRLRVHDLLHTTASVLLGHGAYIVCGGMIKW